MPVPLGVSGYVSMIDDMHMVCIGRDSFELWTAILFDTIHSHIAQRTETTKHNMS